MSLIGDALKTAQRANRARGGTAAPSPRMVESFFPHSERPSRARPSKSAVIAGGLVIVAGVAVIAGRPLWNRAKSDPSAPATLTAASTPARLVNTADSASSAKISPANSIDAASTTGHAERLSESRIEEPESKVVVRTVGGAAGPRQERRDSNVVQSGSTASARISATMTAPAAAPVAAPVTAHAADETRRGATTVQVHQLTSAQEYAEQARHLAAGRDFAEAARRIALAIQADGGNASLYHDHGVYLEQSGDAKAAERAYRQAVEIDARFVAAWVRLGIVRQRLGRVEEARDAYQHAVAVDPAQPVANSAIGELYADTKAYSYARPRFEAALRGDSTYAPAHYGLANILFDSHDRAAALHHYRQFLKFRRDDENLEAVNFVKARVVGLGG